ncbi:PucR family transcriptional regulator [Kineococcus sp. SYSU DK006]|uniref:PucR family transcriptional regulator n=1 Tax=Kineococcus sp. SYSU DK006 TaxID=3383127 RepID=UPI003D7D0A94
MPTVADLLGTRGLDLVEVVPARPDPVRWVTTSELLDPTAFLEGGEVLLTTGLGRRADADWSRYAADLAAAGVVAVGFGAGLSHAEVPPALERACRVTGPGLFAVPRPTPFIAVARTFVDLLRAEEQDAAATAVVHQRELARAATRPDAREAVVRRLAQALGGQVLVVDPDGAVLTRSPARAAPPPDLPRALRALGPQGLRGALSEQGPEGAVSVHPVGLRGRPAGHLVVRTPLALDGGQRSTVATAVALLGLAAETGAAARADERRLRGCALSLLLRGDRDAALRVLAVAEEAPGRSGAAPALAPRVRVLRATGSAEAVEDALQALETRSRTAGAALVAAPDEDGAGLVAVVGEGADPGAGEVERLLLAAGCRVGTGTAVPLDAAGTSAQTAREALRRTRPAAPVFRWDDVRSSGVGSVLEPGAARAFATALLHPVLTLPDRAEAEALLGTAREFLSRHGQRQPTAEALGVHRNTVRLRIARLEQLLGRSFDEAQLRADLWIALQHADDVPR